MSGVKNLRAMFEQKQDASPPERGLDRGRSPGDSSTRSETPPRPLSKVRTNFIAVQEKDGRIGLRRDPSDDGSTRSLSRRRLSVNTEEGSVSAFSERTMAFTEPIPESPRAPETIMSSHGANGTNVDSTKLLELFSQQILQKAPIHLSAISTDKATKAATTTTKTLRKQRSSINQSRPSLGPPPKKAQDHPVTKKEREVDEGFLARMMRPTQSSSSKLSDKVPITPPRKAAPKKDASSTKASTSTTASGRKKIGQPAFAATGSPGQKKIADTEQVALVETAEDAISVAAAAGIEEPAEASPARVEAEPAKELELEPTVVEEPELEEAAVEETAADVEAGAKTDAAAEEAIPESEPASASAETSPAEEDAAEVLPAVEDAPVEAVAVVEDEEEPKEPVILDTITPPPDLSTPEAKGHCGAGRYRGR
ncbi:predicted protein [Verticillium alfalfae VaMs.102]|uniref:Predicted protein n=1 Tax=Verticillium alfalfae (strain VaMs.102 / ATCC MYA-4576 / FGSC 10136) TaxID=526221 RepID=C9SEZ3_VERA1|nr:predicted protein [Verticillium alfalfae VaMs.102]EEY17779.1 predicted protein [Verticillium alfalfae VaMs.102]